jgi:hypothetical protein
MVEIKKSRHAADQISAIARELSKLAIACDIQIGVAGTAERILKGDDSICGRKNEKAFRQMRKHLMALFPLEEKAIERLGAQETKNILDQVRTTIMELRAMGQPGRAHRDSDH